VVVITGVKMCLELLPSILMIKVKVSGMVGHAWFFFLLDDNSILQFKEETKNLPRLIIFIMGCDC
jgi:hypothetical protein